LLSERNLVRHGPIRPYLLRHLYVCVCIYIYIYMIYKILFSLLHELAYKKYTYKICVGKLEGMRLREI